MAVIDSQIPLVDRVQEFEELKTHLSKATQGQGNLVFIAGEAGVGKTRLVDELKTYAQSQGIQILQGWSLYESLTPYMPFVEALRSANLDYLFSREEPPKVECVYLITDTGLLIKDETREDTKLDSTIFAGMLTAVGDFVKDSLTMLSGEERKETLDTLGYEKYRILIESGKNTNLVVILTGRENEFLVNDMREVLVNVNKKYGNILKAWDGDDNSVRGIENVLKPLITSGKYDGIDYAKDDPQIKRNRLFENISLGIERYAKVTPSILCIEDLQWIDPSSLALMHFVARNTKKCNLLILGTYRPEDVAATVDGKPHHLIEAMQVMSREDIYQKIELKRLEKEYMDDMLSSLLGKTNFTDEFMKQLYLETEGNPFFIVSLLRMLIDEKSIKIRDDVWILSKKLEEMNIPSKVHDVIVRRLNRVKEDSREILDFAAVIGEEFTSDILANSMKLDKVHLLKQLRTFEQSHKLIRSIRQKYKFDHAKIKEILYSKIPEELRMEYHAIIADSIENLNKDNLDNVIEDLAFHYYYGKDKDKDGVGDEPYGDLDQFPITEPSCAVPPVADADGPYFGALGDDITFDASDSYDCNDEDELQYRWDFDNDGIWDTDWSSDPTATCSWEEEYSGTVMVEVTDGEFYDTDSTTVIVKTLEATIVFDPETLNLLSEGEYVTVYIELPDGYDVEDIDLSSLLLNGEVPIGEWPWEIEDEDEDGIPDLKVKFDREAVQELLKLGENESIVITGLLNDGTAFGGEDRIRVIKEIE